MFKKVKEKLAGIKELYRRESKGNVEVLDIPPKYDAKGNFENRNKLAKELEKYVTENLPNYLLNTVREVSGRIREALKGYALNKMAEIPEKIRGAYRKIESYVEDMYGSNDIYTSY